MEQRARPGEGVCTVYSANVWVALPTLALHIHTCVPSASQWVSQTWPVCESVWHTCPLSKTDNVCAIIAYEWRQWYGRIVCTPDESYLQRSNRFSFLKCQSLFWGWETKYLSELTAIEVGATPCHIYCFGWWIFLPVFFTEYLCPLKLLMDYWCLHIFPSQVGKEVFEECHKRPCLLLLSKLFHRNNWEQLRGAVIGVCVFGLLVFTRDKRDTGIK